MIKQPTAGRGRAIKLVTKMLLAKYRHMIKQPTAGRATAVKIVKEILLTKYRHMIKSQQQTGSELSS